MSLINDFARAGSMVTPSPEGGHLNFGQRAQDLNKVPPAYGDKFWEFTEEDIDVTRWNQKFPYQLLVLIESNGSYEVAPDWSFTLPVPPEALSISTPFAISTAATLNGIVEEHNGAPFRTISIQGTTGVLPNRETPAANGGVPDVQRALGGIAAGLVQSVASSALSIASSYSSHNLTDTSTWSNLPGSPGRGTGYYQFRLLQKFLESYVAMKKRPGKEFRQRRLALAIWKDQAVYIVSPVSFELRRTAGDPLGYPYSMQFKAWRRVRLAAKGSDPLLDYQAQRNDPTVVQNLLNVILEARSILSNAHAALEAVRGDVDALVFEPLRQVTLLAKDLAGVAAAAADLPSSLLSDVKGLIVNAMSVDDAYLEAGKSIARSGAQMQSDFDDIKAAAGFSTASGIDVVQAGGASSQALSGSAEPVNKIFDNPVAHYDTLAKISVDKLQMKPSTKKKMLDEVERVRRLTRLDYEKMRDQLQQVAADFADSIGDGSATYSETYDRPSFTTTKQPTDEDYDVIFAMNNAILEMNRLVVSGKRSTARLQAIEYVAGLARRSGIAFTTPVSKYPVPFPYGSTLELLALRYLGDANRWHEIAALNGLRTPYVDEEGFELPLLTNGRLNQVTVGDASQLYVGQPVTLTASNTPRTKRRITKLDPINSTMVIVYLDGDEDLDRFGTMGGAKLHAYKPDTVNSTMQLYIPSQEPLPNSNITSTDIPGVDAFTPLLEAGGVDLLLTPTGDLAVTPDGDCKLAVGLQNLIQRVRIAIATPRGSLPQHPSFGLGLKAGMSTADLDAKQLLEATRGLFRDDPAFSGVLGARVQKSGPGMKVSLSIGIAGQDIVLPVSVDVRR